MISEDLKKFAILNIISCLLLLAIFSAIYATMSSEKEQFKYIYYCSKILTIKNIIIENHYSEVLLNFSNSDNSITLSYSYKNLLNLVQNKNGCISGYRPCGILDTYGNVLCIDEFLDCPINRLKVDHINKIDQYSSHNYNYVSLSNINDGNVLFYSNNYEEGKIVTIIIKTKDEPKYITNSNFLLDSEAYKDVFGDQKFLNDIADIFGIGGDKAEAKNEVINDAVTIFQIVNQADGISLADFAIVGAKLLLNIINNEYNKKIEKFDKYVKEQIQILDEENIDKFFEHIGYSYYVKNYIGFKNVEDINKFMKFDFNIYRQKFPSFKATNFALSGLIIMCFIIVCCIFSLYFKDNVFCYYYFFILQIIGFYGFSLGFFIYAIYALVKVNTNKELDELKSIESDEFINSIIDDYVSECKKSSLAIATIVINFVSIVINIIAMKLYKRPSSYSTY